MFFQPELQEVEVRMYEKQVMTRLPADEASKLMQQLQQQVNVFKSGNTKLEDLVFQELIINLRAYLLKYRIMGPPGLEGYYIIAIHQQNIGWTTLPEAERVAYSDFIGKERLHVQEKGLKLPRQDNVSQEIIDQRSKALGDSYCDRAMEHIKEPF